VKLQASRGAPPHYAERVKARTPRAAIAALAVLAAAPVTAHGADLSNSPIAPRVALPGDASVSAVRADHATWIVGVRRGGGALALAHGAQRLAGGAYLVARGQARALAAALRTRGLLDYAEPNRIGSSAQAPAPDPLSPRAAWREFVTGDAIPPVVGPDSPLIALVDTMIDVKHPEIAGSNITTAGGAALTDLHGTATATTAAAPANGVGFLGIWPGARATNFPLPDGQAISCADSVRGIAGAIRAGAAVVNMSYGSPSPCLAEADQILRAVEAGAVPVAAAGNEGDAGNPLEFPASLAHVITVSAIGPDLKPTGFSNANGAVDLAAPGIGILTGVPVAFDTEDDAADGFSFLAGTSFSAPMVSAVIAWVRQARPELTPYQAAQVVRLGAFDVAAPGYDNGTGFGAADVPGALALQPPPEDPAEPNDDIRYVDGRAFGSPGAALFDGRGSAKVAATADFAEDPVDVYRIKVRGRHRVRLKLKPSVGDPDLFVFGPRAGSVSATAVRFSAKSGRKTDRVAIRNRSGRTRTYYAAIGFRGGKRLRLLNASYTLRAG
jgi:hypothetical protein